MMRVLPVPRYPGLAYQRILDVTLLLVFFQFQIFCKTFSIKKSLIELHYFKKMTTVFAWADKFLDKHELY